MYLVQSCRRSSSRAPCAEWLLSALIKRGFSLKALLKAESLVSPKPRLDTGVLLNGTDIRRDIHR